MKKVLIVILFIVAILGCLSIPSKYGLKDGGTIVHKAVLWEHYDYHTLPNNKGKALRGTLLKICGVKVKDNTKWVKIEKDANASINDEDVKTANNADLSKETSIELENATCLGQSINAKVVNGDIQIYNEEGKAALIKVGNAKYLYQKSFMACDNIYLFFINEDGDVYSIKKPQELISNDLDNKKEYSITDIHSTLKKLTNSNDNATAFINNDKTVPKSSEDDYGYTSYNIGISDSKGKVTTITYEYVLLP